MGNACSLLYVEIFCCYSTAIFILVFLAKAANKIDECEFLIIITIIIIIAALHMNYRTRLFPDNN